MENSQIKESSNADIPGLVFFRQSLRKHWALTLAVTLTAIAATAFYTLNVVKIYRATATIQFDPNPPRPLGQRVETVVDMGSGNYWNNQEYYETQYKIITSSRVIQGVVHELGLQNDAAFIANVPSGKPAPAKSIPEDDAIAILRSRLKIEPVRDSRLTNVHYNDADPARAQKILQALVDVYTSQNLDEAMASTANASDWLNSQLDTLKRDLELSERSLHQYKESKQILSISFDDQSNLLRSEMKQISDALTSIRTKKEELIARKTELAKLNLDNTSELPSTEMLQSILLQQLRTSYELAKRDRDALIGLGKGTNHPDVLAADSKVLAAKSSLIAEVRNIQGALSHDLAIVEKQEGGLSALFERAKRQALDLGLLEIDFNRLQRTKENNQRMYSLVLERAKESDLTRMLRVNNVRILEAPTLPKGPVSPNIPRNIALGGFIGLLLGVALAVLRGRLDDSFNTPDELESGLGVTFLLLLPDTIGYDSKTSKRRSAKAPVNELVVHDQPKSNVAEATRTIRTNLLFMALDNPYRTLLITSGGPSEGKTTVASCISISLAQAGHRVVLVDCDLRRPRVHRIFGRGNGGGVTTALMDDNIDAATITTQVPNLSVIPAGPIPPNPAELLHSIKFKKFLEQLQSKYDRIVIDSSPLMAVADAAILSTLVDGTLLVVRAHKTSKTLARHALRSLQDVGARIAGSVMNGVNLERSEYKYSYYYYRREGYYETAPADTDIEKRSNDPPHANAA